MSCRSVGGQSPTVCYGDSDASPLAGSTGLSPDSDTQVVCSLCERIRVCVCVGVGEGVDNRANREMYEVFYKQYKEKRNKSSASKVHSHFTEEDSRNRIHPMRLKGSNPYLL